jgi:hypothetical protein
LNDGERDPHPSSPGSAVTTGRGKDQRDNAETPKNGRAQIVNVGADKTVEDRCATDVE